MHSNQSLPKTYLEYPPRKGNRNLIRILHAIKNIILFPIFLMLSFFHKTPGLAFRVRCIKLGILLLFKGCNLRIVYTTLVTPMDSVRYFEFDFMWKSINKCHPEKYLDVSSPRLFPLLAMIKFPKIYADFINPDKKDLPITESLAHVLNLDVRCQFHNILISEVNLQSNSFNLITCISVLEHIENDEEAVAKMWNLLKPGGMLLISVPCSAKASEEYININEYELIATDKDGFVFWQRYYDQTLLEKNIFNITGNPCYFEIFAEKIYGNYKSNVFQKRTNPNYPYWREPYMISQEYEYKNSLSNLPGMAVIAMQFYKPLQ